MKNRLRDAMQMHVSRGELPGLVTLISRGNDVDVDAIGTLRVGGAARMERDAIFRISSMTKPMVAAVAMMLVEEGIFTLDTPIDRFLPELAQRRVLKRLDGPLDDTVPAVRAITVRDLLSFRVGFGVVWGPPDALPIQRAANALHLGAFGPPKPQTPPAPDEWVRRFATLPLMKQPGDYWLYNTAAEILGVLLARASGRPLDVLLKERLFAPLGMVDTAFAVPAEKMSRFATSYAASPKTGALDLFDDVEGDWSRAPLFPSAGGGLVSTVDDCFAFARMMKEGGAHGNVRNVRLLSRESIAAMTTDQIPSAQKVASRISLDPTFWDTFSWGLGLGIVTHPEAGGPRGFGWDGGLGTSMWWDADRIAILMTQRSAYPKMSPLYRDFWSAIESG